MTEKLPNPLSPSPIYDALRPAGFSTLGAMRWNHTSDPMFLEQLVYDNNTGLTTWRKVLIYPDDLPIAGASPPEITLIQPTTNSLTAGDFDIFVVGTGFTPNCIVTFDGVEQPTTFVDTQDLIILIQSSLFTEARDYPITVRRPADSTESAPITFSFLAAE